MLRAFRALLGPSASPAAACPSEQTGSNTFFPSILGSAGCMPRRVLRIVRRRLRTARSFVGSCGSVPSSRCQDFFIAHALLLLHSLWNPAGEHAHWSRVAALQCALALSAGSGGCVSVTMLPSRHLLFHEEGGEPYQRLVTRYVTYFGIDCHCTARDLRGDRC